MSSDLMAVASAVGETGTSSDRPPVVIKPPYETYKYCTAEGCDREICLEKSYYRRYSLCKTHLRAPRLVVQGKVQRFCNQCSRFHPVEDFDGDKRSCRETSARHTLRRRLKLQEERMQAQIKSVEGGNAQQFTKTGGAPTADGAAASASSVAITSAFIADNRNRPGSVTAGTSSTQVAATTQVTVSELPMLPSGAEGLGGQAPDHPVRLPDRPRPRSNSPLGPSGSQQKDLGDTGYHKRGSSKGMHDMLGPTRDDLQQYDSSAGGGVAGWDSDGVQYAVPGRQAVVQQAQGHEAFLSGLGRQPSGFVAQPTDLRAQVLPESTHAVLSGCAITSRSVAAQTLLAADRPPQPLQRPLQPRHVSLDSQTSHLMSYDAVTTTNPGMASTGPVRSSAHHVMHLEDRLTPAKRTREDTSQGSLSISALSFRPLNDDVCAQHSIQPQVASIRDNLRLSHELKLLLQAITSEQQQTETLPSHQVYCSSGKSTDGSVTRQAVFAEPIGGNNCRGSGSAVSLEIPSGVCCSEHILSSPMRSQGQAYSVPHVSLQGLPENFGNVRNWTTSRGSTGANGPEVQSSIHMTNGPTAPVAADGFPSCTATAPVRRVASDLLLGRRGGVASSGAFAWPGDSISTPGSLLQTSLPSTLQTAVNCGVDLGPETASARWRVSSVHEAMPLPPSSSSLTLLEGSGHASSASAAAGDALGRQGRGVLPAEGQHCSRPFPTLPSSQLSARPSSSVQPHQHGYDDIRSYGQLDKHEQLPAPSASWGHGPVANWLPAASGELPISTGTPALQLRQGVLQQQPQRQMFSVSQAPIDSRQQHPQLQWSTCLTAPPQHLQTHQESAQQLFYTTRDPRQQW